MPSAKSRARWPLPSRRTRTSWQIGRLADWQTLHWPGVSDPDIIGETADPDHDGLPNLLEFALGKSPKTPNPAPTSLQFQPTDGILFSYTRKLGVTGMVSLVEWSETLADGSWSSISVGGETILSYDPPADIEVVSVPVSTGTSGRRFVRLRVARE